MREIASWLPVTGDWNGTSTTQVATEAGQQSRAAASPSFVQTGYVTSELTSTGLAQVAGNSADVEQTTAGQGWFIEPTLAADAEFSRLGSSAPLPAIDPQGVDQLDLATVVDQQLGQVAGLDDLVQSANTRLAR